MQIRKAMDRLRLFMLIGCKTLGDAHWLSRNCSEAGLVQAALAQEKERYLPA